MTDSKDRVGFRLFGIYVFRESAHQSSPPVVGFAGVTSIPLSVSWVSVLCSAVYRYLPYGPSSNLARLVIFAHVELKVQESHCPESQSTCVLESEVMSQKPMV